MIIKKYNGKKIPSLEVFKLNKEVKDKFSVLIKESGVLRFSKNLEVWTSLESNKSLSYFSHGIFRYFGKFPPLIASHLINKYTKEGDYIVDPMCGSGTTGLEALLLNRKAACFDVNPLSVLISKVKVTKLNKIDFLKHLELVKKIIRKVKIKDFELVGLKDPSHWFLPETISSLSKIRHAIKTCKAPNDIKDAFMIAMLGVTRKASRATTQQGRLFLDVLSAQKDATPLFFKRATEIIEPLSQLPKNNKRIFIEQGSILENNKKITKKTKLIICHPPYFNSYKYSGVNSLELSWLGINHANIRAEEVREAFKVGKIEKVEDYIEDMKNGLINLSSCLEKNGRLALMIGDTFMKGKYVPVTKKLIKEISNIYKVELSVLRIPKFTEASWAASQRRNGSQLGINLCDIVIILKKYVD